MAIFSVESLLLRGGVLERGIERFKVRFLIGTRGFFLYPTLVTRRQHLSRITLSLTVMNSYQLFLFIFELPLTAQSHSISNYSVLVVILVLTRDVKCSHVFLRRCLRRDVGRIHFLIDSTHSFENHSPAFKPKKDFFNNFKEKNCFVMIGNRSRSSK